MQISESSVATPEDGQRLPRRFEVASANSEHGPVAQTSDPSPAAVMRESDHCIASHQLRSVQPHKVRRVEPFLESRWRSVKQITVIATCSGRDNLESRRAMTQSLEPLYRQRFIIDNRRQVTLIRNIHSTGAGCCG
jgi:hypothetical protein